jgi:hypothetical protein
MPIAGATDADADTNAERFSTQLRHTTPTPSGCPANDPTSFSIHMSPPWIRRQLGEPSIV